MSAEWVVITGASRGIGLAAAKRLLAAGGRVVAAARDIDKLKEAYSFCDEDAVRLISWDFSEPGKVQGFADKVMDEAGPVRGLVYCAGIQLTLPLSMSKPDLARKIFGLNTFSAMEAVRCFSKKNIASSEGASFVLISSLSAREGALGKSLYGASKGALEGFLPAAAAELAQRNIRLNCIAPGLVKTDMSAEFLDRMTPDQRTKLESAYPLGFGEPEDVAAMIEWLLSPASRWVTGQIYVMDGGHSITA